MSEQTSGEIPNPTNVGGQAVLEGVMMRAPGSLAIVVRRRNGSLVIRERSVTAAKGPSTWPFLRGMLTLFSSLKIGSSSLRWSAEILEADLLEEERLERKAAKAARRAKKAAGEIAVPPSIWTTLALSIARVATLTGDETPGDVSAEAELLKKELLEEPLLAENAPELPPKPPAKERSPLLGAIPILFAVGLFIALPQLAASGIRALFHLDLPTLSPGFQLMTGAAKLVIIIGYLSLIRMSNDVRRVFQYHGAEHKAISTYEHGKDLVVSEARPLTTLHARCGTTFLIMMAFVSVVMFSFLGAFLKPILPGEGLAQSVGLFVMKLPLLPVIAGITYELQRFFARYCSTGPLRAFLWPGFLVQKITTAEPDDGQLEVALASLRAALAHASVELPADHPDRAFATYGKMITDEAFVA